MSFDWKDTLRTVAPTLAAAFGGPLAGTAVKVLGDKLLGKTDATEAEVQAALTNMTPEQLVRVREIDAQFAKDMKALDIDLERIGAEDRDSARKREVALQDWSPRILGGLVVVIWALVQWQLMTHVIPQEMRELVARVLGTLDGALMLVLTYFFGSSSGSARKDAILGHIAQS